jgi:sec-independent protein translocase protein TatB
MFDIGGQEFILLVILALLVFGPRRLPKIGRTFGQMMGQARAAVRDFRGNLEREVAFDEMKQAAAQVEGLRRETSEMAREFAGIGAPPPADPQRRLREVRRGGEAAAGAARGVARDEPAPPAAGAGADGDAPAAPADEPAGR